MNHAERWDEDPAYRAEWAAKGCTRNTKTFLTVCPWVPSGPYDRPPRTNPEVLKKFKDLVSHWIGHTIWMVDHNQTWAMPRNGI